jgi:hypothetical protein
MKARTLNTAAFFVAMFSFLAIPAMADEGHSYEGEAAFTTSFYLIGGQYHLYVNAQLTLAVIDAHRSASALPQSCTFGGNFSRLLPTQDTMHMGPAQVSTPIAYKKDQLLTLPPGLYRLYIAPATDCQWSFTVVSTQQNSAGIATVQMVRATVGGRREMTETASLHDRVLFSADFRTDHNAMETVSGTMQIIHNGQIIRTAPLQFGTDLPARGQLFSAEVQWEPEDAKYLGKNEVKFTVKIGSTEFTSTGEFNLTQ